MFGLSNFPDLKVEYIKVQWATVIQKNNFFLAFSLDFYTLSIKGLIRDFVKKLRIQNAIKEL